MKKIILTFLSIFMVLIGFTSCSKDDDGPATVSVTGITLDQSELNISKGETVRLKATVTPSNATNQTVTWRTLNNLVAAVDQDGSVTATGGGTTEIFAKTEDGQFLASCTVNVTVPVQSITVSKEQLELVVGQKYSLTTTVLPDDASNKKVKWSTSNDGVVSVDYNGQVTAKKPGTALVTATTEDGYHSASCTITVRKAQDIDYNPYGDGQKW